MSKEATPEPKKKRGFAKIALFGLLLLGVGGGGTYGAMAAGLFGPGAEASEEELRPQPVLKGEEDPYAPAAEASEKGAVPVVYGSGGSKYRTAYFDFTQEFTSNLGNSTTLVQMNLAAATHYDGRVLMWLAEHETALRSRILVELASTPEADLMSPSGKERLQKRLTGAINEVLTEREGFGGIDDVYFRSFIVQ